MDDMEKEGKRMNQIDNQRGEQRERCVFCWTKLYRNPVLFDYRRFVENTEKLITGTRREKMNPINHRPRKERNFVDLLGMEALLSSPRVVQRKFYFLE
jgi:hypothetical protein